MKYSLVNLGALVVASLGITAQAALIEVGEQYTLKSSNPVPVGTGGNGSAVLNGVTRSGGAIGVFVLDVWEPGVNGAKLGTLSTFCTDLDAYWASGKTYHAEAFVDNNGVDQNGVDQVSNNVLWHSLPYAIQNAAYLYNEIFLKDPSKYTSSGLEGGAMQLAIWKVLYDSGVDGIAVSDFTTGTLRGVNGSWKASVAGASDLVNQVNAARNNNKFVTYDDIWLHPTTDANQGFLAPGTPVPEPSTIIAGALLLLPFGASAIRRIRINTKA